MVQSKSISTAHPASDEQHVMTEALHTPRYRGSRREFCGPTAMAAVTGADIDDIRDALRQASGKIMTAAGAAHPVMGVGNDALVGAMALLGWSVTEEWKAEPRNNNKPGYKASRLGDFLDERGNDGPFIVNVTGHYYAVSHGEICDTYTKLPTEISKFRRRAKWVERWWKFSRAKGAA